MKYSFSILILSLIVILIDTGISQEKPDGFIIKTSIPENPIVGIKNDENQPQTIIKKVKGHSSDYSTSSQLNKQNYELNSVNMIIEGGSKPYDVHTILTERTGSTAGTIWVVAVKKSVPSGSDQLSIYKFEQNSWVLKTNINTFRIIGSSIDAEIIERSGGDKYLWIVCESKQSSTAKREIYVVALDLQTLSQGSLFTLNWPGSSSLNEYYNPRIATDNGVHLLVPWIFIVASMDSIMTNGKHVNAQKFAIVSNPWDVTNLSIYYRKDILPVFWPDGGTNEIHYLYSDVAYIHQPSTGGKIIFTYSNVPDDTRIWLSSCLPDGTNAQFIGTIDGQTGSRKKNSAIASAGGLNQEQLMVVFEQNFFNSGDWDLVSARSNDGALTWTVKFIEGSNASDKNPTLGSIVSRKGVTDDYHVSYTIDTPVDSVMSIKSNNDANFYWDSAVRMSDDNTSVYIFSAAGFTNTPSEHVTVWARELFPGYYELISGFWPNLPSAVDDESEINPNSFHLYQNFPNPFNPTTKISWQSPVGSWQTIKVYDVLGTEVAKLVDEYLPAGTHKVDFDASHLSSGIYFYRLQTGEFISSKKMILIK